MIGADVSLKCLMLAKGLVARGVGCASEAVMAQVCFLVSSETCCRQEIF